MFANLYPFHQPKTAMQLSIIRPNTSFLVTCLANKTNHPVRSPSTCHAPPKNLPCTTTHRLHFYINQSCTTNKSTQKICHAPPLIEFISISTSLTSHAPPPEFTAFRPDKILPQHQAGSCCTITIGAVVPRKVKDYIWTKLLLHLVPWAGHVSITQQVSLILP